MAKQGLSSHLSLGCASIGVLGTWHLFGFLVDISAWSWQAALGASPQLQEFGGIMTFLTLWGQFTQALYFLAAFIVDLKISRDLSHGWEFLSRSEDAFVERNLSAKTQSWIAHRNRFFCLAFAVGNMVGLGYWLMLFPNAAVREDFLSSSTKLILCLFQHAFTFIFIYIEMFSVNHKYGSWILELVICLLYGACYLGWNFLCHAETGVWAYPSIQQGHPLWFNVLMYSGLVVVLLLLYIWGRVLSTVYWRWRQGDKPNRRNSSFGGLLAEIEV